MDKEIWKDIKDYKGLYQVSNYGNVRSLTRNRLQYNHTGIAKRTYYGKFLKKQLIKTTGYYYVTLYDSRKKVKMKSVHRLVAEAFILNPNSYPVVNHIDGNKLNNNVSNLEWCTISDNVKHAYKIGLVKVKKLYGKDNPRAKKVEQYDINNNFIKLWESIIDASKKLKINSSSISAVCKEKRKTAGGYIWKYERR